MSEHQALRFDIGATVVPGDRLGAARHWTPGPGTYLRQGTIYAAAAGALQTNEQQQLSVQRTLASQQVVQVHQIVLCRIVRLSLQQVTAEIVAVPGLGALPQKHEAMIRREDVANQQTMELSEAFRPGDWVVARVLSLGDTRRYVLSTAEPQLGVIHAVCARSGQVMLPCRWNQMECPETGIQETRKCARPQGV